MEPVTAERVDRRVSAEQCLLCGGALDRRTAVRGLHSACYQSLMRQIRLSGDREASERRLIRAGLLLEKRDPRWDRRIGFARAIAQRVLQATEGGDGAGGAG